jgi:hypothetical protein
MTIGSDLFVDEKSFKVFAAIPDQERLIPPRNQAVQYFL